MSDYNRVELPIRQRDVLGPANEWQSTPVHSVMSPQVTCVTSDLSLEDAAALLLERRISGAPVVDDGGRPIGVVSKTDLLRERIENGDTLTETPARDGRGIEIEGRDGLHVESSRGTVADVMMPLVFVVRENAPLAQAAALLASERIHRVVVIANDGRVTGILSALDVAGWLAREAGYLGR